jgi:glyoxylase-like metal-dependent hydrolase (beta-lactamase superfamily II)
MRPVFEVFTIDGFEENTFLVGDADAGMAVVVDPGGRTDDIVRVAALRGVRVTRIVNTHTHYDHVTGVEALRAATGAAFWIHPDAQAMLEALPQQATWFGLPHVEPPKVDGFVHAGEHIAVGDLALEVRATPGHAPGHIVLVGPDIDLDGSRAPFALVGDVIFHGSIGRTDLPGGDYDTLMQSIERELLSLPGETVLYSGHGPATTVARERQFNPFVRDWLRREDR